MNITTLIVLAWLFGAIDLTRSQLIEALDQDTEGDLDGYDFGSLLFIADIDKFADEARIMALVMLMKEVHRSIATLLPKDMDNKI